MKNLNLASLFNLIILFLGVLVVSLILFTLLKLNLIFKIILSAALAVIVLYFAYRRESRYFLQTKADAAAKGRLNEGMHILNTCALDEILPIFLEFFSQNNICAKTHKRYLLINDDFCLYLGLYVDPLTEFVTKNIIDNNPFMGKRLVIVSNCFSEATLSLCAVKDITLVPTKELVPLINFDKLQSIPTVKGSTVMQRIRQIFTKQFLSKLYARKNFKRFFVYGVILFLLSSVSFYPVYYIISGGIFIVNGLIALLFGKNDVPPTKESAWFFDAILSNQNKNAT